MSNAPWLPGIPANPALQQPVSASPVFDNPIERADRVMDLLLSGAPRSAFKAAVHGPMALSPTERRTLAERLNLPPPFDTFLDISTNPAVLLGLILTVAAPLSRLTLAKTAPWMMRVKTLRKTFAPLDFIRALPEQYAGTNLPAIAMTHSNILKGVARTMITDADDAVRKALTLGKSKGLTSAEHVRIPMALDGLANPQSETLRSLAAIVDDLGLNAGVLRGPSGVFATRFTPNVVEAEAVRNLRGTLNRSVQQLVDQPEHAEMGRLMLRRLMGFTDAQTAGKFKVLADHWPHMTIRKIPVDWADSYVASEEFLQMFVMNAKAGKMREIMLAVETGKGEEVLKLLGGLRGTERTRAASMVEALVLGESVPGGTLATAPELLADPKRMRALLKAVAPYRKTSPHLARRLNRMVPDPDDLVVGGANPQAVSLMRTLIAEHGFKPYSLQMSSTIEKYISKMSLMYAWSLPPSKGVAPMAVQLSDELMRLFNLGDIAQVRSVTFARELVPAMLNSMTPSQLSWGMRWSEMKLWAADKLGGAVGKMMPQSVRASAVKWLQDDRTSGLRNVSSEAAMMFYSGALGMHLSPILKNLTQTQYMYPLVGARNFLSGHRDAVRMWKDYLGLRWAGMPSIKAIQKAFPDFSKHFMDADPMFWSAMETSLDTTFRSALSAGRGWRAFKYLQEHTMVPFMRSEMYNKVSAFQMALRRGRQLLPGQTVHLPKFGGDVRIRSLTSPEGEEALGMFARGLTGATQFGADIMNIPGGLRTLNPLFRQFMQFPTRMLSFYTGTAVRDPAIAGRLALIGGLGYEVAKQAGVDLSSVFLFGPLPGPSRGVPFAPMPMVPPIFQLLASVMSPGEWAGRTLPLMIPGGLQLSKVLPIVASTAVGKPIGKLVNRPYVEWDRGIREPETGRELFPLHRPAEGLIGYFTKPQLMLKAFGIASPTEAQERLLTGWLLKQRENVRRMKRDYLTSVIEGDESEALSIAEEFQRTYPGMGGLPIRRSDLNALHASRNVARIERLLQTIPPDLRPQFAQTIAISMGAGLNDLLGLASGAMEAGLLGGSILERDKYRARPRPDVERALSMGFHGMKMPEKLEALGFPERETPHPAERIGMFGGRGY